MKKKKQMTTEWVYEIWFKAKSKSQVSIKWAITIRNDIMHKKTYVKNKYVIMISSLQMLMYV